MSEGLFPFAVGTSAKPGSWFNCCTDFLNTLIIVTSINVDRQVRREWIDGRMAVTAENMGVAYLMLVLPGLSALNHYPILKQHMSGSGGEYAEKALQKKKTAEYARSLPKVGE